jgi:hypothetical protein
MRKEREERTIIIIPLTRVSTSYRKTNPEHEDDEEGREGDEKDVRRACRQYTTEVYRQSLAQMKKI